MSTRRSFLTAAAAGAWAAGLRAQRTDSRIEILTGEPIGTIAPELYGLCRAPGGGVYDGIWVGEKSSVPNIGGLRKHLVDALAKTKPGVIRWPGGCFADQYDWRDGVGPREKRPTRTNFRVDSPERPKNARRDGPQTYDTSLRRQLHARGRYEQPATLAGLHGSASRNGRRLTLTVANPSFDQPREAEIAIRGAAAQSARVVTLAATDARAHNSFQAPAAVMPKEATAAPKGGAIVHRFPPVSVTKLEITLG
ncbi:MAG: hypothetical protein KIT09_00925 [Bryobacteraceae bacterium]|nr:hypothetical protein [Bryobacteraceae bacterium]